MIRGFDRYLKQLLRDTFGEDYLHLNDEALFEKCERRFFTNEDKGIGFQFMPEFYDMYKPILYALLHNTKEKSKHSVKKTVNKNKG